MQSGLTQQHVAHVRDAERNSRAGADRLQAQAVDQADGTVETTDDATQVFTDAEGTGSQGRAFSDGDDTDQTEDNSPDDNNSDDQHIDFEA
ncbi:MAG: hypothetical protein FWC56_06260 [Phycisphaerae bacterium]|nr:hypothetical protein [Phycisphaerae bacterium]